MDKGVSPSCLASVIVLLLLASGMVTQMVSARLCQSQSHMFKGLCTIDHNCALVCRNEGFTGGRCRGFRHRCFCTKDC